MTKNLLRSAEIVDLINVERIHISEPVLEIFQDKESHYDLPELLMANELSQTGTESIENDLSIKEILSQAQEESRLTIEGARTEADNILLLARQKVEEEKELWQKEQEGMRQKFDEEMKTLLAKTQEEADLLRQNTHNELDLLKEETRKEARQEAYTEALRQGDAELKILMGRAQSVVDHILSKREDIFKKTQQMLVDILLVALHRLVKINVDEHHKIVVQKNLEEILQTLHTATEIVVRVNLADVSSVEQSSQYLLKKFDKVKSLKVFQDNSIAPGGCIVSTDFGEVDARVLAQLEKISLTISDMNPFSDSVKL